MAHKKGVGSSKNGRESESKRLGVKIYGGQAAIAGNISFVKEEQNTIQAITFTFLKTTRFTQELTVLCAFRKRREASLSYR